MKTSYNPFSLEGKTILVTGASSGIGQATAIECSKMGATLVITGRNEQRLKSTLGMLEGEGHKMVMADLTAENDIKLLVDSCGHLDGAAICNGIIFMLPSLFSTPDKFEMVYSANLFAPIELSRILVKKKKITKGGAIVYIASTAGVGVSYGNSTYGSAKSALISWMRYFANEMKPKGIRVTTISPGMICTPAAIGDGPISEEQFKTDQKNYLYNRYGEPNEVGQSVVYLLSDAAKWISGINLIIDGAKTCR